MTSGFLGQAGRAAVANVRRWKEQNLLSGEPVRDRRPRFLPPDGSGCGVIAEIKLRSPSRGDLMVETEASGLLDAYVSAGAECVSVVVEEQHFGGSPELFRKIAGGCELPLLWKDFVVDPFQARLAAHLGASGILIITGLQGPDGLRDLIAVSRDQGLRPLVEIHSEEELDTALTAGADLVGINNRNLVTLEVDLSLSESIAPSRLGGVQAVAESGMRGPEEVRKMADMGYRAVLVGESLVTARHPDLVLASMVEAGRPR